MASDPVTAAGGLPPTTAPVPQVPSGRRDFATVLAASQRDPAALETVTLGEMLAMAANPAPTVPAAPVASPQPGGGPRAVSGMRWPVQGRMTSEFGPRVHPVTGARRDHDGLDIAAPTGTPIGAVAPGRVTFAGAQGGYGNVVIIDHGDGLETRYAHQDTIAVEVGQVVAAGQRIGAVGSTGLSTGPHLHFEVRRRGTAVDPRSLLRG